jgi:hypothetical protein
VLLTYFFNSINKKYVLLTCKGSMLLFRGWIVGTPTTQFVGNFCPKKEKLIPTYDGDLLFKIKANLMNCSFFVTFAVIFYISSKQLSGQFFSFFF